MKMFEYKADSIFSQDAASAGDSDTAWPCINASQML